MSYSVKKYQNSNIPGTGLMQTYNPGGVIVGQAKFLCGRLVSGQSFSEGGQRIIAKFKWKKYKL